MSPAEIRASGDDALQLCTTLLQRARLADPVAGLWEAADVQWWSRRSRPTDEIDQVFWVDAAGPVGAAYLTSWGPDRWQCDPIVVPDAPAPPTERVWARAVEQILEHASGEIEVPVGEDDVRLRELVTASGLVAGEESSTAWLDVEDRGALLPAPEGFVITDRSRRVGTPHPMRHRNGEAVEERLRKCSLYDPELDLAVETQGGQEAGYSLYWFDPVTGTGLVEPVRVEDEYGRRGLARAMLTEGIERLARRGARRVKIGYGTDRASALYRGIGFRPTSTDTVYAGSVDQLR